MKYKLTFVMAVGRYKFLKMAISSIIQQTFKDWELLLYNNKGSRCDTKTDRIRIVNTNNWSPPKCYNHAVNLARSPFILIATDDDYSFPERAQITYDYLQDCDMFGGSCIEVDERMTPQKYIRVRPYKFEYQRRVANTISLPFAGYRKIIAPKFNEDLSFCYDYLFNLEFGRRGLYVKTSPIPLGFKRVWSNSLSANTPLEKIEQELNIIREIYSDTSIRNHNLKIIKEFMAI